ncbi:MAG: hypothetical protein JWQ71_3529 [Pedosphaera sp.]|nr:hypothetical protein [Pedosphaera sp.]
MKLPLIQGIIRRRILVGWLLGAFFAFVVVAIIVKVSPSTSMDAEKFERLFEQRAESMGLHVLSESTSGLVATEIPVLTRLKTYFELGSNHQLVLGFPDRSVIFLAEDIKTGSRYQLIAHCIKNRVRNLSLHLPTNSMVRSAEIKNALKTEFTGLPIILKSGFYNNPTVVPLPKGMPINTNER